jgi:hypothetical protein
MNKIRPSGYEVRNGEGVELDVSIDPESLKEDGLFFRVEQDGCDILICEDGLLGIVEAIEALKASIKTREGWGKDEP